MVNCCQTMISFAKRLTVLMMRQGLNQVALAKKTGIHQTTISNWLAESKRGKLPSMSKLLDLKRALNCSLEELTGLESLKGVEQKTMTTEAKRVADEYDDLPDDDWRKKAIEKILLNQDEESESHDTEEESDSDKK